MRHGRGNRHCPAEACGRVDAAAALQQLAAECTDTPARGLCLRLGAVQPVDGRPVATDLADASSVHTARHVARDLPCQAHDPDLWFAAAPADLELAKALCANCPALLACLAGALDRREPVGVWGGQIFQDGGVVTFKRPRGRPRKDSTPPEQFTALPDTA
jgi:WhiB family transcriptional regulator, redox-sensing transcriptional regulator